MGLMPRLKSEGKGSRAAFGAEGPFQSALIRSRPLEGVFGARRWIKVKTREM